MPFTYRLAVGEHGGVVALEEAVHKAAHALVEHLQLGGTRRHHVVERERLVLADHDLVGLGRDAHARLVLVQLLATAQWPHLQFDSL